MPVNNSSKSFPFPNTILKSQDTPYTPWDVIVSLEAGGNYNYSIIPSTVNQIVPSNYQTIGTGNISSAKYLNLNVSATNGRVTSVAIESSSSPNTDAPAVLLGVPPSSFKVALGVIGTNGIFYKFVAGKPLLAAVAVSFEVDRDPPVPGLSLRVPYLTWNVSQP